MTKAEKTIYSKITQLNESILNANKTLKSLIDKKKEIQSMCEHRLTKPIDKACDGDPDRECDICGKVF